MQDVNRDQVFEKEDHSGALFNQLEFYRCHFKKCNFSTAIFRDCSFENCHFEACDGSNLDIDGSSFLGVRFSHSKLIGVQWQKAGLSLDVSYTDCVLSYGSFFKRKLPGLQMIDCLATELDFTEVNLRQANFAGTQLSGARFSSSQLQGADFSTASDYYIDLSNNKADKAIFSLPEAASLLKVFNIVLK